MNKKQCTELAEMALVRLSKCDVLRFYGNNQVKSSYIGWNSDLSLINANANLAIFLDNATAAPVVVIPLARSAK